jgi:glycolate oxidase FAD binding subunit
MYERVATRMREAAAAGRRVRVRGGGTKLGWGAAVAAPDVEIDMREHDRVLEHNAGDLTAVVQAGVPLARLQEELREHGQMLAIDPPRSDAATIGGVIATGDSGPLRHRHGAPRDLVLGMTVALSDGTIARTGGKVIKNVAGYDLAKLFTGSFGTLGAILDVSLRLHPLPAAATAVGLAGDPDLVAGGAWQIVHSPYEAQCVDVRWEDGRGMVLARFAGGEAVAQAHEAMRSMAADAGFETELVEDDGELWDEQRSRQRSAEGVVVRVSGVQTQIADQIRAAGRLGGSLVARAAHGLAWVTVPGADAVDELRRELAPSPCVVLDGGHDDPWGAAPPALDLMRRVKERFDPAGACNPGVFAGGI